MTFNKDDLRQLMAKQKEESLVKADKIITKYRQDFEDNAQLDCDLMTDPIRIHFCETQKDKQKWAAFLHLTSSLPYRGFVGRRKQFFVKCGDAIIGMVQMASPLAQSRPRDEFIGFKDVKDKWANINKYYNICACVSTAKYSQLLTGKLLVYLIFSKEVKDYLENAYNGPALGFEITSLFGKSSIYNRIPFVNFLGETDGYSAVQISDDDWLRLKAEWLEKCGHHKQAGKDTTRLAEAKFQVLAKLQGWYKRNGLEFPYAFKQEETKRGVYFGYLDGKDTADERVEQWRERWLKGRLERGYGPQTS
jgi:hypothetical protein